MRTRISQEISLSLKTETEGRRKHRLAHDRHVMQSVVKAERKADNEQRRANLDVLARVQEVGGIESVVGRRLWHGGAVNLDCRDVDRACGVDALAPDGVAMVIQRDRKAGGLGHVLGVIVELDLQTVREMTALFILHHVPARDQEQTFIALEKKAACIRSQPLLLEGANPRCSEQERVYRRILLFSPASGRRSGEDCRAQFIPYSGFEFIRARPTGKRLPSFGIFVCQRSTRCHPANSRQTRQPRPLGI